MKPGIAAAFVLALSAATVSAAEIPDQGRKGVWSWKQNVASTEIGKGVQLMVAFSDERNCGMAMLMVGGNTTITELGLTVDGQFYGYAEMTHAPGTVITGVWLGSEILNGLKNGNSAKVVTNVGSAPISLSGSSKAINSAYGNCKERNKPIMAHTPLPGPSQTARERSVSFLEKVRADGSEMFAANDVVVVLDNIQVGDDVLLKQLVAEMEVAGMPFKSVIFTQNGGGALETAIKMGRFIRSKGANTAIGGGYIMEDGEVPYCASACVYAFAGGVQRTIYLPAKVGMHQASLMNGSDGTMEDGQRIVAAKYEYLSLMGVDPEIVIEGSKRSANEMWWFSGYEAKGYGLVTRVTKPHKTSVAAPQAAMRRSGLAESSPQSAPPVASSATSARSRYPDRYSHVSGPSFGCDGQLQPTERIICEDPNLARADGVMGAIYRDARAKLDKTDADALRASQRGWLKQRNLTCPVGASDLLSAEQMVDRSSCLRRATDRRISELWEIVGPRVGT